MGSVSGYVVNFTTQTVNYLFIIKIFLYSQKQIQFNFFR